MLTLFLVKENAPRRITLRIANGCRAKCSYCVIRYATGDLRSKSIDVCVDEYQKLLEKGYKQIVFDAEDTGQYGADIGSSFGKLLSKLSEIDPGTDVKWSIQTLSPQYAIAFKETLIELVTKGKIFNANLN